MDHPLDRFVAAQAATWETARAELVDGAKRSHWMWWIFPQIAGLGRSDTARRYAIASVAEARAYLAHPLLGPRLLDAVAVLAAASGGADDILGPVDAMKLRSSMTLFAAVADDPGPFRGALDRFFDGRADAETLARL